MNLLNDEQEELLRLSAVPGVGPNKMRALVGHFVLYEKYLKLPLVSCAK